MYTRIATAGSVVGVTLTLLFSPAPADGEQKPKEWNPVIDPTNFVSTVDNQYFPLIPGRKLFLEDKRSGESLVFAVTMRRKLVMGVTTTVVVETVKENGEIVEISENWFAQDRGGNVWYFGEASQDFQNGLPAGRSGSWEAGVNDAVPGIIMGASPGPGDTYFQEHAPGVAEDMASVQSVNGSEWVPYGSYSGVLKTKEWTPLESGSVAFKYYAPGIGLILDEKGRNRLELVRIE